MKRTATGRTLLPGKSGDAALVKRQEALADFAEHILGIARTLPFDADVEVGGISLSPTEINVVRYITRYPSSTSKEVAHGVGLLKSNFSTALKCLKAKGMVVALPDCEDGRSARLFPTPLAKRNIALRRQHWAAILDPLLGSVEDIQASLTLLETLDNALRLADRTQPCP